MTAEQQLIVKEVIEEVADWPLVSLGYAEESDTFVDDYIFALKVEFVCNNSKRLGIPWSEIHSEVKNWLK